MRTLSALALALYLVAGAFDGEAWAAPRKKGAGKKSSPSLKMKAAPPDAESEAPPPSTAAPSATRGPTRIDFDDRLIQGQTNKSGAVYLYDRKELKTRSMIKRRESFRDEIVSSVYDN